MPGRWSEAWEREHRMPGAWLAWALRLAIVGAIAYGAWSPEGQAAWEVLVAVGAFALAADLPRTDAPWRLKRAEAVLLSMLLLHAGGYALGAYRALPLFDAFVHAVNSALAVYVLYAFGTSTRATWLWRRGTPAETAVAALALAVLFGVLWEFYEVALELTNLGNPVRSYFGTAADLLADVLGAGVAAAIAGRVASGPEAAQARRPRGTARGPREAP